MLTVDGFLTDQAMFVPKEKIPFRNFLKISLKFPDLVTNQRMTDSS
jgi:hypothetical protein